MKAGAYDRMVTTLDNTQHLIQGPDQWQHFMEHCNQQEKLRLETATTRTEGMAAGVTVVTPKKATPNRSATSETDKDNQGRKDKCKTCGHAPPPPKRQKMGKLVFSYCWTHGVVIGENHNSNTCNTPGEGHGKDATFDAMMGGNDTMHKATWINKGQEARPRGAWTPKTEVPVYAGSRKGQCPPPPS